MCHLFIVGRLLSLFTENRFRSAHDEAARQGEREAQSSAQLSSIQLLHIWRNKSHHRHQHRQIQAHHCVCVRAWKKDWKTGNARKNYYPFPTSIFSSYVQRTRANECLHVFAKKNGWWNENLYVFAGSPNVPKYGALVEKRNVTTSKQRHNHIYVLCGKFTLT